MKHIFVFLFVLTVSYLSQLGLAWSEEVGKDQPSRIEMEEQVLSRLNIESSENRIRLFLQKDGVVELDFVPHLEKMKQALGLSVSDEVRAKIEASGGVVPDINPMEAYETMSEDQRRSFESVRLQFLVQAARILDKMQGAVGVGIVVGDSLSFIKETSKKLIGKGSSQAEKAEISERKRLAIQGILQGLDYKLWSQAPLVIHANEFGIQASVGIIGLSGFMKKGGGGVEEVGLSLAFNKTQKAFVFEIFHSSERFESAALPVINIGINGKAGVAMSSRDMEKPTKEVKGGVFYPPAFPGSTAAGPELFTAGLSTGLGFPPPPIADFLTFSTKFQRNAILRISVSPVVKGFIRVQIGDVKTSMKLITYRFVEVFNAIRGKVLLLGRSSCQQVFAVP